MVARIFARLNQVGLVSACSLDSCLRNLHIVVSVQDQGLALAISVRQKIELSIKWRKPRSSSGTNTPHVALMQASFASSNMWATVVVPQSLSMVSHL